MSDRGVKAILGYDIEPSVSVADYEAWLADIHFPDLLANPHLTRIETNTIVAPIAATSAGTAADGAATTFYRIAELHFADHDAYRSYLDWFGEHPIDPERGPKGRTAFRFYVLSETTTVDREHPYRPQFSPGALSHDIEP